MVQCITCGGIPLNNDEIYFDVSYSYEGLDDVSRIDAVICYDCIESWISSTEWDHINLIKRIKNPTGTGS